MCCLQNVLIRESERCVAYRMYWLKDMKDVLFCKICWLKVVEFL